MKYDFISIRKLNSRFKLNYDGPDMEQYIGNAIDEKIKIAVIITKENIKFTRNTHTLKKEYICSHCQIVTGHKHSKCAKCLKVRYCNTKCQKLDWIGQNGKNPHKSNCQPINN